MGTQMNYMVSKEAKKKLVNEAEKLDRKPGWVLNKLILGHDFEHKHITPTTTVGTAKKTKEVKKKAVKKQIQAPIGFDQFWAAYPRKSDGRPTAVKAWTNLNANEEVLKAILVDIQARITKGEWSDPKFIPMPSTYLNQGRWVGACHETQEAKQDDAFMNVIKEMEEEDAAKERTYTER